MYFVSVPTALAGIPFIFLSLWWYARQRGWFSFKKILLTVGAGVSLSLSLIHGDISNAQISPAPMPTKVERPLQASEVAENNQIFIRSLGWESKYTSEIEKLARQYNQTLPPETRRLEVIRVLAGIYKIAGAQNLSTRDLQIIYQAMGIALHDPKQLLDREVLEWIQALRTDGRGAYIAGQKLWEVQPLVFKRLLMMAPSEEKDPVGFVFKKIEMREYNATGRTDAHLQILLPAAEDKEIPKMLRDKIDRAIGELARGYKSANVPERARNWRMPLATPTTLLQRQLFSSDKSTRFSAVLRLLDQMEKRLLAPYALDPVVVESLFSILENEQKDFPFPVRLRIHRFLETYRVDRIEIVAPHMLGIYEVSKGYGRKDPSSFAHRYQYYSAIQDELERELKRCASADEKNPFDAARVARLKCALDYLGHQMPRYSGMGFGLVCSLWR
jgi:hypothetical protein